MMYFRAMPNLTCISESGWLQSSGPSGGRRFQRCSEIHGSRRRVIHLYFSTRSNNQVENLQWPEECQSNKTSSGVTFSSSCRLAEMSLAAAKKITLVSDRKSIGKRPSCKKDNSPAAGNNQIPRRMTC
jgi:hypothetical protein